VLLCLLCPGITANVLPTGTIPAGERFSLITDYSEGLAASTAVPLQNNKMFV
jgi:hypothetical protein